MLKRLGGVVRHNCRQCLSRFSRNRRRTPSNTRSCLPVNPLAPFVRVRRPEPGKPGHKLRGSWPSPRRATTGLPPFAGGPADLPSPRPRPDPASTPRPYSTPRPPPRPLPASRAQPLTHRPALPLGPEPSKCPELAPAPTPRPVRPGLVSHSRRAPPRIHVPTSPATRPGPGSARPGHWSPRFGPVYGHPPRPCLGAGLAAACAPAEPTRARGPGPGPGAGLGPGGVAASRHEGLGPPEIRTRAGWGRRRASFFISPPPPPQGRASPLPAPLHLGRASPAVATCSSPRCRGSGRSARRRRWRGVLGSGRWALGGHVGRGRRRRKGAGLQFSGLPCQPGEAGTSPGSRRPALATGRERSHLPRPALGSRKEGASNAARGRRASDFARAFCVTLSLLGFSLCVSGWWLGSCVRGVGGAPTGRPAPSRSPLP